MAWELSVYSVVILSSAAVAIIVGIGALRNRPDPMAVPLAILMAAGAAWAIPHAISLGFTEIEQVVFWHRVRYPGTVAAPVAYLVVALTYAGHDRWLSRRVCTLLSVIPLLTVIAVWTNPTHHLFWESLSLVPINGASILTPEFGPLYWLNVGYLYLLTTTGLVLLGRVVLRSGPMYRKQAVLMFLGGVAPLTTNVIINLGVGEAPMVDFTTTVLAISGLMFALALFHFDLLEIRPVARDLLIEELADGVIVVGPNEEVRDFNPTAVEILDELDVNQPVDEVLPTDVATDGGELLREVNGQTRHYRTRTTPLPDQHGRESGKIIYLNDVTDLAAREQRISVLNRILRHNIRNELNVVSGRLEILEDRVDQSDREHVEMANKYTQRVIEFADKARTLERTLQADDSRIELSLRSLLEETVREARTAYPEADIELLLPPGSLTVYVVDEEIVRLAITELIDNAVSHADQTPQIAIRIDDGAEQTQIRVSDNCPPIPEEEIEVLDASMETDFHHGRGLGLWLVKWAATLSSGNLSFMRSEPEGNTVILSLPVATD